MDTHTQQHTDESTRRALEILASLTDIKVPVELLTKNPNETQQETTLSNQLQDKFHESNFFEVIVSHSAHLRYLRQTVQYLLGEDDKAIWINIFQNSTLLGCWKSLKECTKCLPNGDEVSRKFANIAFSEDGKIEVLEHFFGHFRYAIFNIRGSFLPHWSVLWNLASSNNTQCKFIIAAPTKLPNFLWITNPVPITIDQPESNLLPDTWKSNTEAYQLAKQLALAQFPIPKSILTSRHVDTLQNHNLTDIDGKDCCHLIKEVAGTGRDIDVASARANLQLFLQHLQPVTSTLIKQIKDGQWAFVPEPWQYKLAFWNAETQFSDLQKLLQHPHAIIPNMDEKNLVLECLRHAIHSKDYENGAALLALVDRSLFHEGNHMALYNLISFFEEKCPIMPQLQIRKARICLLEGRPQSARVELKKLDKNRELFKNSKDCIVAQGVAMQINATIAYNLGNLDEAYTLATESCDYFKKQKDYKGLASSVNIMADSIVMRNAEEAAKLLAQDSLQLMYDQDMKAELRLFYEAKIRKRLGYVYCQINNHDSLVRANEELTKCIELLRSTPNNPAPPQWWNLFVQALFLISLVQQDSNLTKAALTAFSDCCAARDVNFNQHSQNLELYFQQVSSTLSKPVKEDAIMPTEPTVKASTIETTLVVPPSSGENTSETSKHGDQELVLLLYKLASPKNPNSKTGLPDINTGLRGKVAMKYDYNPYTNDWVCTPTIVCSENVRLGSGASRDAWLAHELTQEHPETQMVLKLYRDTQKLKIPYAYFAEAQTQIFARFCSVKFNTAMEAAYPQGSPPHIDILPVSVIFIPDSANGNQWFFMEPYIGEHKLIKYTDNLTYSNQEHINLLPQAFSHYTYEATRGNGIVCDIQGWNNVFTDLQVNSVVPGFVQHFNHGAQGIEAFLHHHQCNDLCKALQLTPCNIK